MTDNVTKTNRATRWFRETVGELRKVNWPTTQETWNLTKIVLLVMLVMAAILGLLDFIFSNVITSLVT
jgi:preprotein translocase subunit SecE